MRRFFVALCALGLAGSALILPSCFPSGPDGGMNVAAISGFHAEDLNGKVWDQDRMNGQVVLIDFWATWCGPCIQELPYLKTAYERHRSEGFEIIGISLDDADRAGFRKFVEAQGVSWPQVHEGMGFDSHIAREFGVSSIPRSLLFGRDGTVLGTNLRGPRLIQAVEKAVREKVAQ